MPDPDYWRVRADQLLGAGDPRGETLALRLAGRNLRWPLGDQPSARDIANALWPQPWPELLGDLLTLRWPGIDPLEHALRRRRIDELSARVHLMDSGDLAFAAGDSSAEHASFDSTVRCLHAGLFSIRMRPITTLREPALPTELPRVTAGHVIEHLRSRAALTDWSIDLFS